MTYPSWSQVTIKVEVRIKVETKSESRLVSKSIFEMRKYKLYYLFKYSKSMVEFSSIIITDHT